ncbi:Uncharacterised protein [BD1-7 clade bacterium]|uniref:Uncharacterized protein n=1 Tax=BD1-7 clade bacterium TaxID=2029982 RepID=A0A5S9QZD3_9GAMM|nr:Uncharacterised protein [BD1-7 clade bacterium]CAA0121369.1 Uncharacterised protein [BD1-7 clade bacterium]CAA0124337.1 Uncharacterised protein [BD1-7 clade bacterium]
MKNWMLEIEERSDKETAKIIIQMLAGSLIFASFFVGNWHLLT